jgi:hypothetical protein
MLISWHYAVKRDLVPRPFNHEGREDLEAHETLMGFVIFETFVSFVVKKGLAGF